jgi:hypothetical protein
MVGPPRGIKISYAVIFFVNTALEKILKDESFMTY